MKALRPLLTAILSLAAAGGVMAGAAGDRVEVKFFEPENFADVRDSYASSGVDQTHLAELADYVEWRAPFALPAGHKLTVTFTDIDLAGDFEPWRGMRWSDVRIVKPIYPARLAFSFIVTDAAGNVVRSGERELRDRDLLRLGTLAPDALRFEKGLLDDWFRSEFRPADA